MPHRDIVDSPGRGLRCVEPRKSVRSRRRVIVRTGALLGTASRIAAAAIALRQLRSFVRLVRWKRAWRCADPAAADLAEPDRILVVAYREPTALLLDSYKHFESARGSSKYLLVLHESDDPRQREALVTAGVPVSVCSSPSPLKGSMLNWVLAQPELEGRSVAIYDSDSRPEGIVGAAHAAVVQQPSLYAPRSSCDILFLGMALNQTRWSCAEESHRTPWQRGWYSVSHGLSLPRNREAWPSPSFRSDLQVEDLEFGYRSRENGVPHRIDRRGFDVAEAPDSLADQVAQASRWFMGELRALSSQEASRRFANRWIGLAWWLAGPSIVTVSSVVALSRRDRLAIVLLSLALSVDHLAFRKLLRIVTKSHSFDFPRGRAYGRCWLGFLLKPVVGQRGAIAALLSSRPSG